MADSELHSKRQTADFSSRPATFIQRIAAFCACQLLIACVAAGFTASLLCFSSGCSSRLEHVVVTNSTAKPITACIVYSNRPSWLGGVRAGPGGRLIRIPAGESKTYESSDDAKLCSLHSPLSSTVIIVEQSEHSWRAYSISHSLSQPGWIHAIIIDSKDNTLLRAESLQGSALRVRMMDAQDPLVRSWIRMLD